MACIEGFFVYNAKGDPIIHRVYRSNLRCAPSAPRVSVNVLQAPEECDTHASARLRTEHTEHSQASQPSALCSLRVVSDIFRTQVLHSQAQVSSSAPVCQAGALTLAHIANRDIFLVAVVRNNANVVMALQWLSSVC